MSNTSKKNAKVTIGYLRKSTDEKSKQIRSLDDQKSLVQEAYERLPDTEKKYPLEMVEESQSAFHPGRPIFNSIMKRVDQGVVHAIMVLDPTRLSRNPEDSGRLNQRLADGRLECVLTANNKRYSREDSSQLFMLTLENSISWKDSADKGLRVSQSMDKKASQGGSIGPAPIGYRNAGLVKGNKWMEIDPITGSKVQRLFTLAATGCHSLDQLCQEASKLGLRSRPNKNNPDGLPLSKTMGHQMLRNPVYKGKRPYKGKIYTGKHPVLVKPELWQRVQGELHRRSTGSSRPKEPQDGAPFMMRGCMTCGVCRKYSMSAYIAKQTYIIYECKGRGMKCRNCVNQNLILEQLYVGITSLKIDDDPDQLREELVDAFKERQGGDEACREATEKEIKTVTNSIGSLFLQREDALRLGAAEAVDIRIQSLAARKNELQLILDGMGESYGEIVEQILRCFELQKLALEAVKYASPTTKQIVLKSLASNYFVKSKSLIPEWRSPFLEKSQNRGRKKWLPILERMRTDWAQDIIELGREIKLTGFVVPVQMVELYHARL